jgi:5-methylcytosine-specific restriction endonuclease McrA
MDTKVCKKCSEDKPLTEYYKKLNGLQPVCKTCQKAAARASYEANKEQRKERMRQLYHENKERYSEAARKHYEENKEMYRQKAMKYYASKTERTPQWADKEAIDFVYYCAEVLKKTYGVVWEIDHIIPLNGDNVCGLHVANNLQLLTPAQNRKKSNKYEPG